MPDLKLSVAIPSEGPTERLDRALLRELRRIYPSLSRTALKHCFREGQVQVRGKPAAPSLELGPGKHAVVISPWDLEGLILLEASPSPEGCFLPVVYEDEELLVLHKASGIPSVPHDPGDGFTAVGAALARAPGLAEVGFGGLEPGILHRLDTQTSGLLVFAKTEREFKRLRAAWKAGQVGKFYRAFARAPKAGATLPEPGLLAWTLAHDAKSKRRMRVVWPDTRDSQIRGAPLPALTRVLETRELPRGYAELSLEIETGVLHQIRCTLAELGWPIVGDEIYGGEDGERLFLHAERLVLPLSSGATLELRAALPEDWPKL